MANSSKHAKTARFVSVVSLAFLQITIPLLLSACSKSGGGSSTPPPAPPPVTVNTNAQIEKSLGTVLQNPVFQCGSNADTLNADSAPGTVTVFEGGPVRPLALSADGQRLYVANAPANCLEIYSVSGDTLTPISSVAVGLEPVALAERNDHEVWVVNHLSDSVSVVRLDGTPRVLRTLLVGDEPRDIVFAGTNNDRAFITAAMRGQQRPSFNVTALTTPGIGRADVWVFDAANLDESLNGNPLTILTLFADTPRALAATPDGKTVYAAPFMSGNRTTTLHRDAVIGNKPLPNLSADGVLAPDTGLIVKFDGSAWRDEKGTDWSAKVKFSLPDYDIFAIDASAATPVVTTKVSGVGTTLFNMAVHPTSGKLYVSNTDAINNVRFEGPGLTASTVRGHIAESRISVVTMSNGTVDAVHLNSHVNFSLPQGQAISAADKAKSLAQPTALTFSPDGNTLYVAAFGSATVAALPVATLSTAGFVPNSSQHISVPDGPAGLAVNAAGTRLYVYSRIAHQLSVIDTAAAKLLNSTAMFTPESTQVITGRRLLYDAVATSSNGTTSCASCHIFADMDHLAWDLGNPDDVTKNNPNAYIANSPRTMPLFHPLKGPMTTQTLRGMMNNGPMHWRGDRTGTSPQIVRGALESIESAAFKEFNPAFVSLVGRETPLSTADLQSLTDFVAALTMPPNPVRALTNSLTTDQQAGHDTYMNINTITGLGSCNHCHSLDVVNKKFGSSGLMTFEGGRVSQNFKVPQLRNIYQKVGMFGFSADSSAATGAQISGFGFSNDGSIDTLTNFFSDPVFVFPAPVATTRDQVISFVLAMDTDVAPIVGQQVTWRPNTTAMAEAQLSLMKQRAQVTSPTSECDLVVRASGNGQVSMGMFQPNGTWLMRGGASMSDAALRASASVTQPLTFTCVPPGNGRRIALNSP